MGHLTLPARVEALGFTSIVAGRLRALKDLLKEQRELDRTVRSAKRYKQSPEQLARRHADVPF